jgi:hypothetical protein
MRDYVKVVFFLEPLKNKMPTRAPEAFPSDVVGQKRMKLGRSYLSV